MAPGVSTFKFVGVTSLGLYTGLSYALSALTLPTLLTLPSATTASKAVSNLTAVSLLHLRTLASISSFSFLSAYLLSPRTSRHPYLLWTTLLVAGSSLSDFLLASNTPKPTLTLKTRTSKSKPKPLDASYEVVGTSDRESEEEIEEEEFNGEDVKEQIKEFIRSQLARTAIASIGFAMSVIGIWGDGIVPVIYVQA